MKKMFSVLFVGLLALGLGVGTAQASPLPLTYGDAYYLGHYTPNPANPTEETLRVNILNDYAPAGGGAVDGITYSRVGSVLAGPFPAAVFGFKDDSNGVQSINATGYQYVLAKYGGGQVVGYSLVWFLASGFTGEVAPSSSYDGKGLSHIDVFTRTTTVPDGGMTLMLLGGALVGIGALRRKFRA